MVAIELAAPRVIAVQQGKRQYKLTVGRISKQDWLKYFEGIVSTSEMQNGQRVNSYDSSAARVELVEKNLIDASGYSSDQPLLSISEWQTKLPLSHKLAAGDALVGVSPSEKAGEDDAPIALGFETVVLDAVWGADESGTMRKYRGLVHRFRTPSPEQQRRFSRDASRSVITGGSRIGRTRWLGAQATLAALYDELIDTVDGYTVNGQSIVGASIIAAEMDTYHKVAAADQLFSPATANVEGE